MYLLFLQARLLGSTVGAKTSSVTVMREQILSLEAEVEAQAKELRSVGIFFYCCVFKWKIVSKSH